MDKERQVDGEGTGTAGTMKRVVMRRIFPAPREDVFRAWVEPEALRQWFHPTAGHTTPVAEVDLREGGAYSIVMETADGRRHHLSGVYREVQPPEKLAFTWQWQGEEVAPETLVTVEFLALGEDFTEVVLTHTGFAGEEERNGHAIGWEGTLNQLVLLITQSGATASG